MKDGAGDSTLLRVENLKLNFNTYLGTAKVLDNISFAIPRKRLFGLAGETGCGKTVTAYTIIRLLPSLAEIVGGRIWYKGEDLLRKSEAEMGRNIRGKEIALIMQNPQSSLNPSVRIRNQMLEALLTHRTYGKKEALAYIIDILHRVKIADPRHRLEQYPHELSGGLQQRINTAICLLCNPSLLIADEFTTNLDVTTQAEVMRLIQELQQDFQMSVLLISHDLALMSEYCHSIGIIYAGQMVETGHVRSVLTEPAHPYTKGLLSCIPDFNTSGEKLNVIGGRVPALIEPPTGCRYHPRCPQAITGLCEVTAPVETRLSEAQSTWCHLYHSTSL